MSDNDIELSAEDRVNKLTNKSLNKIVCAANCYFDKSGNIVFMLTGPRHWDTAMHLQYNQLANHNPRVPKGHEFLQGFIDRNGNYKTRVEAWEIAKAAGQILFRCGGDTANGGTLYSENLY